MAQQEQKPRAILGIDPSLRNTGLFVLQQLAFWPLGSDVRPRVGKIPELGPWVPMGARVVVTKAEAKKRHVYQCDDDARCVLELRDAILDVARSRRLVAIVIEAPPGSAKGTRAVKALATAYATVVCVAAELIGIPPIVVSPHESIAAAAARLGCSVPKGESKRILREAVLDAWPDSIGNWAAVLASTQASKHEHVYDAAAAVLAAWDHPLLRQLRCAA